MASDRCDNGAMRRKDLKPAKPISDAAFLAGAKASATKHAKRMDAQLRRERLEASDREREHLQRINQASQGPEGEANP